MAVPNLQILAYEDTPLGPLCLRRRELLSQPGTIVTEVTLNHEFLMSSLYCDSEEALSRIGLQLCQAENLNVLVGGLGLGMTAHEVLKSSRVAGLTVVEFLPQVAQWLRDGLVPMSQPLMADSRFEIQLADVYALMAAPPQSTYDVILIDVDHSPDERLDHGPSQFYTEQGLQAASAHLNPGGVLGVWSYAASESFESAMRSVFANVHVESVTYQNEMIHESRTDWLYFGCLPPASTCE